MSHYNVFFIWPRGKKIANNKLNTPRRAELDLT
jgi:hypothetical protein